MKGKCKVKASIVCFLITLGLASSNSFCYEISVATPANNNLTYKVSSTMPAVAQSSVTSAAAEWNSRGNFNLIYGGYRSSAPSKYDNVFDVAYVNPSDFDFPTKAVGVCIKYSYSYTYCDIFLNSTKKWTNGNKEGYYDYQGILTHEFGHAIGLGDVYYYSGNVSTMYGLHSTSSTNYGVASYQLRSLESDDLNGYNYLWP